MKTARASSGPDRAEHYRALLAEQARSELSVTEFAEEVGLSAATLYAWRRRLSGARAEDREPGRELLEVQVTDGERPALRPSPVVLTIDGSCETSANVSRHAAGTGRPRQGFVQERTDHLHRGLGLLFHQPVARIGDYAFVHVRGGKAHHGCEGRDAPPEERRDLPSQREASPRSAHFGAPGCEVRAMELRAACGNDRLGQVRPRGAGRPERPRTRRKEI
jgi:transposase-like protein